MAKADGSVIIDTKLDTEGIKKGTEEIKEELDDVGKDSDSASKKIGGGLANSFKKLGAAMAAAGVVDALVDFGKQAIDLGSDLEEVQNVVDVTFETMSDSVNKFAKDAQKSAGLSEKMAKQYVGTFGAMADSFGFTEAEAYEMSTALTQLTGDVASFYNLSQDEAMNKLKGVFTGETEALKELGVVMTQAALDNYALANGYEKTTSAMTEQEKVALRYQFVMDQLSASSGDFVRTQDSWANQSKVLSLQWESLMATIGSGLIDVLSPGMEFLNDEVLPILQKAAENLAEFLEPPSSKNLEKQLKNINDSMVDIEDQFESTSEEIDKTAEVAEIYRDMLIDLEKEGLKTAEAQNQYKIIVEKLNEIYPDLNLQIDRHTGLLKKDSMAQLENLDAMKQRALIAAAEEKFNAIIDEQAQALLSLREAEKELSDVQTERTRIANQLKEETGLTIGELSKLMVAQEMGEETAIKLTEAQKAQILTHTLLQGEVNRLEGVMSGLNDTIDAQERELKEVSETFGLARESAGDYLSAQNELVKTLQSDLTSKTGKIVQDISTLWEDAEAIVERTMRNMQADIDGLRGKTVTVVINTKDGTGGYSGKDMSLSNPANRSYTPAAANVPYLASGAVIPPRAPFLAMLGDQRRGTNIEAPLSTIQEALRAELGNQAVLNKDAVDAIYELIATVERIEIGDTVIGQAVDRYNQMNGIVNGGW